MNDTLNVSLKQDTIKANQSVKQPIKNWRWKLVVAVRINGVDDLCKCYVNAPDKDTAIQLIIDGVFLNYARKLISIQEASK